MKERSRSVQDVALLLVIVVGIALATVTVYSQGSGQQPAQTPRDHTQEVIVGLRKQPALKAQHPRRRRSTGQPIRCSSDLSFAASVRRAWAAASTTSLRSRAIRTSSTSALRPAGSGKRQTTARPFTPIFDTYSTASIGDIAIAPSNPDIVWVGTGEANNRQSSSFGDGIYKSTDAGKTFTKMGLEDSQTIARIVIDPKDPNIVYVAVLGHLFGPNKERGVYKTTDGGKTWTNVKFIDEDTGFTDLVMDQSDNKTLYAASYQRRRTSWGFNGGGPGSGLWKTADAGKTWTRSSKAVVFRKDCWVESASTFRDRIQTSSMRRWKLAPASEPVVKSKQAVGRQHPARRLRHLPQRLPQRRQHRPDPKKPGVWRSDDKGKTWRIACFSQL